MPLSRRNFIQNAVLGISAAGLSSAPALAKNISSSTTHIISKTSGHADTSTSKSLHIISLDRLEASAKEVMTEAAYAYIAHGAGDEWTYHENRRAFSDYPLLPHRLSGVAAHSIDIRTDLLGHHLEHPLLIAPMGAHMFVHPEGEVIAAAGAEKAGALYESSGASNRSLEDIAKASKGPKWFQLYFNADAGVTRSLLERAKAAGYSAIIITADALGPGTSDAFLSMSSPFPAGATFGNHDPRYGGKGDFFNQKVELTPADIEFVKKITGLPVIVKGILRGEDAVVAIDAGADAIQVSNHGGRQIDGVPSAISQLQEVAARVGHKVPVIFDSGIRRGIDVVRAISLGATAVAVGRPVLYGIAVGGVGGVAGVIEHLKTELRTAMLLSGARTLKDLAQGFIRNKETEH
ncbi:alpha-hydroxy-acid oxidizing protein [Escherichia coli]|uniref:alpha-hydroxy-acid oxidizing protein n=1 Tax=Escherichia coli TaxID=562 RepID=UPI0003915CC2|nr:alpha-hydroxy-acid oxidizing protein [Escherichia coli]EQU37949.1 lactate oxidase [Escherichia coli HVH 204 (4-3112802)]HBC8588587.1 alpha-hydroxy-acid oxidizing protein [Escherichia coli]